MSYVPAPLLSAPSCWQRWVWMCLCLVDEPLELSRRSPSTPAGYIARAGWDNLPTWEAKYHPCPHRWPAQRQVNFHSRLSVWEAQEGDDKLATVYTNQEEMWEGHSFGSDHTAQQCESSYLSGSQGQLSVNIAPQPGSLSIFASFPGDWPIRKMHGLCSHPQRYLSDNRTYQHSSWGEVLLQDILFLWINSPRGRGWVLVALVYICLEFSGVMSGAKMAPWHATLPPL